MEDKVGLRGMNAYVYSKFLLNIDHCSFVCSRLEYGCAVFSSACKSYLKKLESIQNQGLRI